MREELEKVHRSLDIWTVLLFGVAGFSFCLLIYSVYIRIQEQTVEVVKSYGPPPAHTI